MFLEGAPRAGSCERSGSPLCSFLGLATYCFLHVDHENSSPPAQAARREPCRRRLAGQQFDSRQDGEGEKKEKDEEEESELFVGDCVRAEPCAMRFRWH